ncbi:MAG TPA: hypothetical protein VF823_10535 [Anaerolineales bacterium]
MNCPVKADAEAVRLSSAQMVDALRRLSDDLRRCPRCPRYKNCALRLSLPGVIDSAIDQVNEEWSRSHER